MPTSSLDSIRCLFPACFDSAAVAATLSTTDNAPFTLSVAEQSRRVTQYMAFIKKSYKNH